MAKQHQQDREKSSGYLVKTLCGRPMPQGNSWGLESCERCAEVARARKDQAQKRSTPLASFNPMTMKHDRKK